MNQRKACKIKEKYAEPRLDIQKNQSKICLIKVRKAKSK